MIKTNTATLGITGHDYPPMELHITGQESKIATLHSSGPDIDSGINLSMNSGKRDAMPLFVPSKYIFNSGTTLFMGKKHDDNDHISLYINNDIYAPYSQNVSGENIELFITAVSGAQSSIQTLFLKSPNTYIGSGNILSPLFLKVEEPIITEDGVIINSGIFTLSLEGNNNANLADTKQQGTTLHLAAYPQYSNDMSLFIDRPISEVIPLNINAFIGSGNMNVYISGNYTHNNNTTLLIKPPESNSFKFFFRGYLE